MGRLIYATNMSLDGYVADAAGSIDWSVPSEEVHAFFNDLLRPVGTCLYGRKMYETMVYWETPRPDWGPVEHDFAAVWQDADKVVYSTTLQAVASARTRVERAFDVEAVRRLKEAAEADLTIGGAQIAAQAIRAGLVDDYHLVVTPVVIGGGPGAFPDDVRIDLELVEERRFATGAVHLHYRPRGAA
ncbi:MAG: dihydrofolate reductase family protein [Dehalococcoidia bacterium]